MNRYIRGGSHCKIVLSIAISFTGVCSVFHVMHSFITIALNEVCRFYVEDFTYCSSHTMSITQDFNDLTLMAVYGPPEVSAP